MKRVRHHGMDPRSVRLDPDGARFHMNVPMGEGLGQSNVRLNATAEAFEQGERRKSARRLSGHATMADYRTPEAIAARVERRTERALATSAQGGDRTPCTRCGVRHDLHAEHGCRRYVPA